jgi:hypothetical protein
MLTRSANVALQRVLLATLCVIAACSDPQSPEQQVREVLAGLQHAAEARDASQFMEFISNDCRTAQGQGFDEIQRYLRGYLLTHQSIHLLTRIEQLEFPVPAEARVSLAVGMAGQPVAAGALDLAAELRQFELVLQQQDGTWKVVYGAWQ